MKTPENDSVILTFSVRTSNDELGRYNWSAEFQILNTTSMIECFIRECYKFGWKGGYKSSNSKSMMRVSRLSRSSSFHNIFKKVIRKHLVAFLEKHNLLNQSHSFHHGRSCPSQLIDHRDRITAAMESWLLSSLKCSRKLLRNVRWLSWLITIYLNNHNMDFAVEDLVWVSSVNTVI